MVGAKSLNPTCLYTVSTAKSSTYKLVILVRIPISLFQYLGAFADVIDAAISDLRLSTKPSTDPTPYQDATTFKRYLTDTEKPLSITCTHTPCAFTLISLMFMIDPRSGLRPPTVQSQRAFFFRGILRQGAKPIRCAC